MSSDKSLKKKFMDKFVLISLLMICFLIVSGTYQVSAIGNDQIIENEEINEGIDTNFDSHKIDEISNENNKKIITKSKPINSQEKISETFKTSSQDSEDSQTSDLIEISPITIVGNSQLAVNATSGSGTESDPYIIEGYNITGDGSSNLISIFDTTAHFIIRGNHLSSGHSGITFHNVTNGEIYNNTIVHNDDDGVILDTLSKNNMVNSNFIYNTSDDGIILSAATNNTISKNTIVNTTDDGIILSASNYNTVHSNLISNSSDDGIILSLSNHTLVYENTIKNSTDDGIFLTITKNNTLIRNSVSFSTNGISLQNSNFSTIVLNDVTNTNGNGVYLGSSLNNSLSLNNITFTSSDSINLFDSESNSIRANFIANSSSDGIYHSTESYYNEITNNTIANHSNYAVNFGFSASSNEVTYNNIKDNNAGSTQGYDDGGNTFDYNYWNDHTSPDSDNNGIVDDPYSLDGSTFSEDPNPKTSPNNDSIRPDVSNPTGYTYEETTKGNSISWFVGDENPEFYYITSNDSIIEGNFWVNGSITVDIDGLDLGNYNFTIYVFDSFGNLNSSSVLISVVDTTIPEISSPADITYEDGGTGHSITWIIGDANPNMYNITVNGSLFEGPEFWSNGSIIISVDGLPLGEFNFTLYVNDTSGNSGVDKVTVTVVDTTPPEVSNPSDFTYLNTSTGNEINWTLGDVNPDMYNVTLNGSVYVSPNIWSNNTISINVDGLVVGDHKFTIYVNDTSGNTVSDTVLVTVVETLVGIDTTKPNLSSPSDVTYVNGTTGNEINWTVGDANPGVYNVTLNGSVFISTTSWTNGTIPVNVDGLSIGTHNFTIYVYDLGLNLQTDTVQVNVKEPSSDESDKVKPDLSSPQDVSYKNGSTGNEISWTVGDQNPGTYNITRNGTIMVSTTSWTNGTITVNIDGLSVGVHKITIMVYDTSGNQSTDTVLVEVTSSKTDGSDTSETTDTTSETPVDGDAFNIYGYTLPFVIIGLASLIAILKMKPRDNRS